MASRTMRILWILVIISWLAACKREQEKAPPLGFRPALALQREAGVTDVMRELNADSLNKLGWFS